MRIESLGILKAHPSKYKNIYGSKNIHPDLKYSITLNLINIDLKVFHKMIHLLFQSKKKPSLGGLFLKYLFLSYSIFVIPTRPTPVTPFLPYTRAV